MLCVNLWIYYFIRVINSTCEINAIRKFIFVLFSLIKREQIYYLYLFLQIYLLSQLLEFIIEVCKWNSFWFIYWIDSYLLVRLHYFIEISELITLIYCRYLLWNNVMIALDNNIFTLLRQFNTDNLNTFKHGVLNLVCPRCPLRSLP